jgi:hypothetical protein
LVVHAIGDRIRYKKPGMCQNGNDRENRRWKWKPPPRIKIHITIETAPRMRKNTLDQLDRVDAAAAVGNTLRRAR